MSDQQSPSLDAGSPPARERPPAPSLRSFLTSRWRGEVPLETVFWRDMILIGTTLNAIATVAAMFLVAAGAPTALVMFCYFAPMPWNLFIFFSVWRSADRIPETRARLVRIAAAIWFLLVTAV